MAAVVIALMTTAPHANAQSALVAAIVVWAEGPDKDLARAQAASALGSDFALVDARDWQAALAQQGHHGPLAPALKDARKRGHLLDQLRRAARALQADKVIVVVTSRAQGGRKTATLIAIDSATSDAPSETDVQVSRGDDNLTRAVQQALTSVRQRAADTAAVGAAAAPVPQNPPATASAPQAVPAVTAPVEGPRSDAIATAATKPPAHRVGEDAFEVSVGFEGGMRHFAYKDGFSRNLRNYGLGAGPLWAAEGQIYPLTLADVHAPVLRDVGVVLGYARAFGVQSTSTDAGVLRTQWSRFTVGGRVRASFGSEASPLLGFVAAYGDEAFAFGSVANTGLPAVDYRFMRASADVRMPIGRLALLPDGRAALFADVGYLYILSPGDVAARFPKSAVGGVEAELGGAIAITSGFEARVTASYRRFFYAMNPTPGDTYVAGGALDEFGGLQASVAYVY